MTEEKTINCDECKVVFTYEVNPKYPRKYCLNCSARKKTEYKQSSDGDKPKDEKAEAPFIANPPIVKMPESSEKSSEKDDPLAYQIRSRECRARALGSAIEMSKDKDVEFQAVLYLAKQFEDYIQNGN